MADIHRVWVSFMQFPGRLTDLRFLGQDTDTVFRQIFNQPGMDDVEALICIPFSPAMPGQTARPAIGRGFEFNNLGFNGKAKGLEAEARVRY